MADGGFFLALPAQSIAVRLLIGALVAVLAARVLLHAGLRVPRVRVVAALVPTAAVLTILLLSFGNFQLPSVLVPSGDGGSEVVLQLHGAYPDLAPLALPLLVGVWALVAVVRLTVRLWRTTRVSRRVAAALDSGGAPLEIRRTVQRIAARMDVDAPRIGIVDGCPGGASVVGIRRPMILLDSRLVRALDEQELEGVLAHELAHVRRRDNLVTLVLGIVRDALVVVPGGRWALRQLLVERELAADQCAAAVTNRPGALAGGLLKVLETSTGGETCAALLPEGTLIRRVSQLVDDRPAPSRLRVGGELTTLTAAFAVVVGVGTGVPYLVSGGDPEAGLGVLVTAPAAETAAAETAEGVETEPRAFTTYRASQPRPTADVPRRPAVDDDPDEVRATTWRACAAGASDCGAPPQRPSLGLTPVEPRRPVVNVARWRAEEVVGFGDVGRLYWLSGLS